MTKIAILNKKSAVLIYIILIGFVAAVATLFGTTVKNFRPDVTFIGESALSMYNNENEVFSQLIFIQSAAYYTLQEAINKIPSILNKCDKYGTYAIWNKANDNCFPSKNEIDTAIKKEFQNSFKPRLEKNKDINMKAENYEYSVINDKNLKFLGVALNGVNYDLVLKTQLAKIQNPIETYQTPLLTIGTGPSEKLYDFSCSARDKNTICQLRAQALQQLNLAKKYAQDQGYELIVNDAYRSYDDQEKICGKLRNGKCINRNAAPAGKSSHQTGGAVDVRLVINGNRNSCGTINILDKSQIDDYANNKDPRGIDIHNCRQKLKEIMTKAGFTNLPSEWWHWEYGTELWAIEMSKQKLAEVKPLYGMIG